MNAGALQQVGTAAEVYDRPANLFVADFVGEPRINLLPGRLVRGAGRAEIVLSDAARIALDGAVAGVTASKTSPSASGRKTCGWSGWTRRTRCRRSCSPMNRCKNSAG